MPSILHVSTNRPACAIGHFSQWCSPLSFASCSCRKCLLSCSSTRVGICTSHKLRTHTQPLRCLPLAALSSTVHAQKPVSAAHSATVEHQRGCVQRRWCHSRLSDRWAYRSPSRCTSPGSSHTTCSTSLATCPQSSALLHTCITVSAVSVCSGCPLDCSVGWRALLCEGYGLVELDVLGCLQRLGHGAAASREHLSLKLASLASA